MPSLAKFVKLSIYLEVNIKKYNLIVNLHDFKLYFFLSKECYGLQYIFVSHQIANAMHGLIKHD